MIPAFDAVQTPLEPGTTLIEASAGTGKTYTITALFVRLLLEENLEVSEILVTTYTEAATAELRDRIRTRLSGALSAVKSGTSEDPFLKSLIERHEADTACAKLEKALRDFDQAAIHTIHGFCQRMLRDRALESGMLFDTELVADQSPILRELVDDFWRRHFATASPIFGAMADACGINTERLLKLLGAVMPRPLLRVVPEIQAGEFERIKRDLTSLHQRLCESWKRDGAQARAALLGPPKWTGANRKLGTPEKLKVIFAALDACLGDNPTSLGGFTELEKLCPQALEDACLKSASAPQSPFFPLCAEYLRIREEFGVITEAYFISWAREELRRRKTGQNILSFDDLLTRLHEALLGERGDALAGAVRQRFRAALIDEFQDTDGIQEAIFQRLFGDGTGWLYLIGDPKQAIYGFRGADIFTYLAASGRAARRYTLRTNRRSAKRLVEAVNHLFGREPGAFVVDGIYFDPVAAAGDRDKAPLLKNGHSEPPFKIWKYNGPEPIKVAEANRELPQATAAAIAELLASNATIGDEPVHPSQIAVLVAQHWQARAVQEALQAFNVPSVLLSDQSVWDTEDAAELHTILEAIARPTHEPLVRAALATEILGYTVSRLEALQESEAEWESELLRFNSYSQRWHDAGFIQMFRAFMLGERVRSRLLALPDGDRRLTNLMHLAELLHRAAIEQHLTPSALLRWFETQRAAGGASKGDDTVLRLERDDDAVNIITMHRSKGLEFEIVFCPYAWGRSHKGNNKKKDQLLVFHDPANQERLTLDLGSDDMESHRVLQGREQLAEEARILYVALTRAIHECHFVWGRFQNCEISAAAWVLHRPPPPNDHCAQALLDHIGAMSEEQFDTDLEALREGAAECVEIRPAGVAQAPQYNPAASAEAAERASRVFSGSINREWSLSSFSAMVARRHSERPYHDDPAVTERGSIEDADPLGIHAFPAGRRTGVCLHRILEKMDYANDEGTDALVESTLKTFSFDALSWTPTITACLRKVLATQTGYGFALQDTRSWSRLVELEFHLPAGRLEAAPLLRLLKDEVGSFSFEPTRGWLKGFIDLVCEHEGRYYIVDWKSDWLGHSSAAYTPSSIRAAMVRNRYTLQLHLYSLALHRYLMKRVPGYEYDTHFGGVMYYFLRGIDPADPDTAIYRCRPTEQTIAKLNQWLNGEK